MSGSEGRLRRIAAGLRGRRARKAAPRLIGLAVLAALFAVRAWDPTPVEILRLKAMDLFQQIEPRVNQRHVVTIVDIDDASLAEIGQWPWPRTTVAELVRKLGRAGAVAVAFDVVFPEPDRMSPAQVASSLPQIDGPTAERLRAMPGNDEVLADTIRGAPVVLGQVGRLDAEVGREGIRPMPNFVKGPDPRPYLFAFPGLLRNVPELEDAATALGTINVLPEVDGVVRRVPTVVRVGDTLLPSLSLELLRLATGQSTVGIKTGVEGVQSILLAKHELPTDPRGRWWVHFAPPTADRYVSAKDVLDGTAPPESIRGKLILVGTSAVGLHDIKATPLGITMAGVEVHAQLVEAALGKQFLASPAYAGGVEIVAAAVIGMLMIVLVPMVGALWALALGLGAAVATLGGAYYMFAEERLLFDVTFPLATGLIVYAVLVYMSYMREEAQRQQVRSAFARYISPDVMERVVEHPEALRLGGQMRELTILFCDIRGFTAISEAHDAEGLTRLINRFLTPMTDVILDHRGTIDKYIGDCIMAFWNAPLDDPAHAHNASEAALDMMRRLETLNEELARLAEEEGTAYTPIDIGIGLNTGTVCVGNMGSEQRFDYSVLGDEVNLASRLEGQTKSYGVHVVVGENTRAQAPEMAYLELDLIRVKGKARPARMFALMGGPERAQDPEFAAHAALHDAMLVAYRAQDWDQAEAKLDACAVTDIGAELQVLYAYYAARIAAFRLNPPPEDWDGVYVAETK